MFESDWDVGGLSFAASCQQKLYCNEVKYCCQSADHSFSVASMLRGTEVTIVATINAAVLRLPLQGK